MQNKDQHEEVRLTNAMLRRISAAAATAAIEAYEKKAAEQKQLNKDKRLHNTRLLLEKYRGLAKYTEYAVYNAINLDKDDELKTLMEMMETEVESPSLTVEAIQKTVARTKIILAHVDRMLDYYQYKCLKTGKSEIERKWRVVDSLFISEDEKTVEELAAEYEVEVRTIYRDVNTATQELCALFFGYIDD